MLKKIKNKISKHIFKKPPRFFRAVAVNQSSRARTTEAFIYTVLQLPALLSQIKTRLCELLSKNTCSTVHGMRDECKCDTKFIMQMHANLPSSFFLTLTDGLESVGGKQTAPSMHCCGNPSNGGRTISQSIIVQWNGYQISSSLFLVGASRHPTTPDPPLSVHIPYIGTNLRASCKPTENIQHVNHTSIAQLRCCVLSRRSLRSIERFST